MVEAEKERTDYVSGVKWIDDHPLFIAIGANIAGPKHQGENPDKWEEFERLESEMMKRGTLSHNKIRWDWVADECRMLSLERTKDFRLLAYMLHSFPYTIPALQRLPLAASLVMRFLSLWEETAYPSGRFRNMPLVWIVDSLEGLVEAAIKDGVDEEIRPVVAAALKHSGDIIAEVVLDLGIRLASLPARLEAIEESSELSAENPQTSGSEATKPNHKPLAQIPSVASPKPENLRLDPSNERSLKQSLSVIADFLLTLDVANPLSYQLRRYATWYGISAPPPIKSGSRTVIQPVSENVADTYRIAAERGQNTAEIVQKLERSCNLQPFWFEGQLIAYRLAVAGGRNAVAEAIRSETSGFSDRISGLDNLHFSDGSALMPPEVQSWLKSRNVSSSGHSTQGRESAGAGILDFDMQSIAQSAREAASGGDLAKALKILDRDFPTPRSKAIWELITLECLNEWGMKSHVALQAERLRTSISNQTVEDWEPELLDRIGRLSKV